jgi:hypothetical protein
LQRSQQQRFLEAALNAADSKRFEGRATPGMAYKHKIAWALAKVNCTKKKSCAQEQRKLADD